MAKKSTRLAYFARKLSEEYERRKHKNDLYSVRAYARDLNMDSGSLNAVLLGKRKLSQREANNACKKLNLSEQEEAKFHASLKEVRALKDLSLVPPTPMKEIHLIDKEDLATLTWKHFTLMALLDTNHFKQDLSWLAKKLDSDIESTKNILLGLQKIGLIEWNPAEGLIKKSLLHNFHLITESPEAQKIAAQDTLQFLAERMESFNLQECVLSTMTMPADPEKIDAASELIKEFQTRMASLMGKNNPAEVYRLSIALYPMTRK